jgi:hypothetical protein
MTSHVGPSQAYRELLGRLQAEQARAARNSTAAGLEQARWVAEGIDAGLKIAIAHAITLFEGHDARAAYFAGHQPPDAAAGPSVAEAAAADRRHWADKYAGDHP